MIGFIMRHCLGAAALLLWAAVPAIAADECPPLTMLSSIDMVEPNDGRSELVPVEIAGVPKLMLLDLGAEISTISTATADELNLSVRRTEGIELYGVTGAMTDHTTTTELKLGRFRGRRGFMVAPLVVGGQAAGLLGTDILSLYDLSIDFGTNKLDLLSKDHCDGKVVYWPAETAAIIPFKRWRTGQIVFDVTLDGMPMKALLDTGASVSTLRIDTAELRFDIKPGAPDTPKSGTLNGRADLATYSHTFKSLDFNGIAVSNPSFKVIPDILATKLAPAPVLNSNIPAKDDAVEAPILIGMNVLKHLHVYVAYKEQKLYITAAGKPTSPAQ